MTELFIDGRWLSGNGEAFTSTDPATALPIWEGASADASQCAAAVTAARAALPDWSSVPAESRVEIIRKFGALINDECEALARLIAQQTGKPLWDCAGEVSATTAKIEISIRAYYERTPSTATEGGERSVLTHRPHGVMAVLGPFNFPAHLPNGHIVPALIAGNTIVFKPSELTPIIGEFMVQLWEKADLPPGVLNLVQGTRSTGEYLLQQDIDGLLFTGSAKAGAHFRRLFADRPKVILALELGGNNPLIAWNGDPGATADIIVQSAFLSSGQRCTCARRLILPKSRHGKQVLDALLSLTQRVVVGAWDDGEEPFMGPLISAPAAQQADLAYHSLLARGAKEILPFSPLQRGAAFRSPSLLDATELADVDEEIFAPILKIFWADDFEHAITLANATRFGLSASIITNDDDLWRQFYTRSRAGIINRNKPTNGASSGLPFGGTGESGNHRPSAYYAADYCAYPVASQQVDILGLHAAPLKGIRQADVVAVQ